MKLIMSKREAKGLEQVIHTQNSEVSVLKNVDLPNFKVQVEENEVIVDVKDDTMMGLFKELFYLGQGTKVSNVVTAITKSKGIFTNFVNDLKRH